MKKLGSTVEFVAATIVYGLCLTSVADLVDGKALPAVGAWIRIVLAAIVALAPCLVYARTLPLRRRLALTSISAAIWMAHVSRGRALHVGLPMCAFMVLSVLVIGARGRAKQQEP